MHIISVNASRPQALKLSRGHAVRIKQGTGFNLIVHPTTYRLATRAFNKGKAVQIKLSPEELAQNHAVHENPDSMNDHEALHGEMTGNGLFSWLTKPFKKFGKTLKKGFKKAGRWVKGAANTVGDFATNKSTLRALKGVGKFALGQVGDLAAGVVGAVPGAGPLLSRGVKNLAKVGQKAIDDPDSVGGVKGALKTVVTGQGRGRGSGFNSFETLKQANRGTASANAGRASAISEGIRGRHSTLNNNYNEDYMAPRSRGAGMGYGIHHIGTIGHGGGMIGHGYSYMPPALISQPFSANYQMSHFLPVQFQHFNRSMKSQHYEDEIDGRGFGFGLYA